MTVSTFARLVITLTLATSAIAHAKTTPDVVRLKGGIEIRLPELPTDADQLKAFQSLTPDEQHSFYIKRQFIIEKLAGSLAKPGIKSGIRWVKDKVYAIKDFVKGRKAPADLALEGELDSTSATITNMAPVIEWQKIPAQLSDSAKLYVETAVSGLVDNMWKNSVTIAKSNGIGMTFVGGFIWNTTLPRYGYVWGRSLSIDIGMDYKNKSGYIRFLYDKQSLGAGLFGVDVGTMMDVLVHITDPELKADDEIQATHVKLPIVGCFRGGSNYQAWGAQLGISIVEMAAGWVGWSGHPAVATGMVAGMRVAGAATVYSTDLKRKILFSFKTPGVGRLIKKLGLFKGAAELESCADDLH